MDTLTPAGRKIILKLLKANIAKYSGENVCEEKENETEIRKKKKRKSSDGDQLPSNKKMKGNKDIKEKFNHAANIVVETDKNKSDLTAEIKIKEERSEIETAGIDLGVGTEPSESTQMRRNISRKNDGNESNNQGMENYTCKVLSENMTKYSSENVYEKSETEKEVRKNKHRKSSHDHLLRKKKNKVANNEIEKYNIDDSLVEKDKDVFKEVSETTKTVQNIGLVDQKHVQIKIKTEYTEMESDTLVKKEEEDESTSPKLANSESYIVKLLRANMVKYSAENNTSSSSKEVELKDTKVKTEQNTRKTAFNKIKIESSAATNMKKEYSEVDMEIGMIDRKTENKVHLFKAKGSIKESEGDKSSNQKHKYFRKRMTGKGVRKFTPEEDKILLSAMEKYGDETDSKQIAKDLERDPASIRARIVKLKTGKSWREHHLFTLAEDIVILDAVLKHLNDQSLKMLNLPSSDWEEVAELLDRRKECARIRWWNLLKPWLLQHYSGTLNLDIRRMLANYLADNFKDLNSIDWTSVATKPEFTGHTQTSLRRLFFSNIFINAKNNLKANSEDITLGMVAEFANKAYAPGGRRIVDRILTRQKAVIDYFECYVKKNCIKNFLC